MASLSRISTHTHIRASHKMTTFCNFGNRIHKLYILRGVRSRGVWAWIWGFSPKIRPLLGGVLKSNFRDGTMERDPCSVESWRPGGRHAKIGLFWAYFGGTPPQTPPKGGSRGPGGSRGGGVPGGPLDRGSSLAPGGLRIGPKRANGRRSERG